MVNAWVPGRYIVLPIRITSADWGWHLPLRGVRQKTALANEKWIIQKSESFVTGADYIKGDKYPIANGLTRYAREFIVIT